MNDFIAQYPEVIAIILGLSGTIISTLLTIIGWFVKRAIDNLTKAIRDLRKGLAEDRALLANHEVRIDILENE